MICNDDGIEARGIRVLEQAARCLSDDVWVIAPATEQSGKAHSFTAKGALNALKKDDRHFCVDGTPTDCVLFAVLITAQIWGLTSFIPEQPVRPLKARCKESSLLHSACTVPNTDPNIGRRCRN